MQAHHLTKERGRLVGGETQIGGTYLSQLTAPAQATERQRRVGAAGNDQVQLWRRVVEQKGDAVVDRLRRDQVVIVEHQHETLRDGADLIEQGPEQRLEW